MEASSLAGRRGPAIVERGGAADAEFRGAASGSFFYSFFFDPLFGHLRQRRLLGGVWSRRLDLRDERRCKLEGGVASLARVFESLSANRDGAAEEGVLPRGLTSNDASLKGIRS